MSEQKNPVPTGPQTQPRGPAQGAKMVTELKVSANLMTLDSGLFCIFNAPGSVAPDPATGLPGVRISLPPGPVFRPDAITITSFRDDGWIGGWNGAALVRVTRGPAQILVTIYQAPNSAAEAPRLQILRLAESAALPPIGQPAPLAAVPNMIPQASLPVPANAIPNVPKPGPVLRPIPGAAAPQNNPAGSSANTPTGGADTSAAADVEVIAHIQGRGDVSGPLDGWMGEPGSKKWIEGFAISPKASFPDVTIGPDDVEYQAVLGRGWLSPWAEGGQYCGSRGMSLPILGLRMRLRGEAAERFDCVVTASFVDGTEVGPLDNGEPCQAETMAPLEAFRIMLIDRNAPKARAELAPPPITAPKTMPPAAAPATAAPAPKRGRPPAKSKPTAPPPVAAAKPKAPPVTRSKAAPPAPSKLAAKKTKPAGKSTRGRR